MPGYGFLYWGCLCCGLSTVEHLSLVFTRGNESESALSFFSERKVSVHN